MENYKLYTEKDLVSFGNYILSENRDKTIEIEENKDKVNDVDLKNWEEIK